METMEAQRSGSWSNRLSKLSDGFVGAMDSLGRLAIFLSISGVVLIALPWVLIDWVSSDVVLDSDLAEIRSGKETVSQLETCVHNTAMAPVGVDPWDCADVLAAQKSINARKFKRLPIAYQWKLRFRDRLDGRR